VRSQKDADKRGRSKKAADDYYRLLQLDPDAPHELVVEAYWYLASKLRAEHPGWRGAERQLAALNAAYAVLGIPERRDAYNATLQRVVERRLQRAARLEAERLAAEQPTPLLDRLLGAPPEEPPEPEPIDYYEFLCLDPSADPALVSRAFSVLRTNRPQVRAGDVAVEYRANLLEAYSVLSDADRRKAYDNERRKAAIKRARAAALEEAAPAPAPEPESVPETAEGGEAWRRLSQQASNAVLRGSGGTARLAKAGGRAIERWRQQRREPREETDADAVERRLLRDAVTSFRAGQAPVDERPEGARLVIEGPSGETRAMLLDNKPVTLGSDSDCDVQLEGDAESVAPEHAQLWFTDGGYAIRSMSPQHPTVVAGQRVNWAMLEDGDEIVIGQCRIRFETGGGEEGPPAYLKSKPPSVGAELLERQD
jgi:curved DNA-binding protein CbpA